MMTHAAKGTIERSEPAPVVRVGSDAGSAPTYDVFYGNNDYDTTGSTPAEALSEVSFELETAMSAVLLLRHGMTKAEALKAVDDLRWLVEKSDLPNNFDQPTPAENRKPQ